MFSFLHVNLVLDKLFRKLTPEIGDSFEKYPLHTISQALRTFLDLPSNNSDSLRRCTLKVSD